MLIITTKVASGEKSKPKTNRASAVRRQAYDEQVKRALPFIERAEGDGCKNAELKARWLNRHAVPAPTNEKWTVHSVHRCLRRLKALSLHQGSPRASACRVLDESQYARRVDADKRHKQKCAAERNLSQEEMVQRARGSTHVPSIAPRIVGDEV
jgi:hypothetical protein